MTIKQYLALAKIRRPVRKGLSVLSWDRQAKSVLGFSDCKLEIKLSTARANKVFDEAVAIYVSNAQKVTA